MTALDRRRVAQLQTTTTSSHGAQRHRSFYRAVPTELLQCISFLPSAVCRCISTSTKFYFRALSNVPLVVPAGALWQAVGVRTSVVCAATRIHA